MDQDQLIERVAKALFVQSLKQARLAAGQIQFDMTDSVPVFRKLVSETNTGVAIISAAYLDECLKKLLNSQIEKAGRKVAQRIFDFNGPLGTFSSRIHLAFGFGLISKDTYQRLNSIRSIRNDFAHTPFDISFNNEKIKNKIIGIGLDHKKYIDEIRKTKSVRDIVKQPSRMTMTETFLIKSVFTLSFMVSEMIVLPIAAQNKVPASAILADFDALPDNLRDIRIKTAECVFEIFGKTK